MEVVTQTPVIEFPYSSSIQLRILVRMCRNKGFLLLFHDKIRPRYFRSAYMSIISAYVCRYFFTYRKLPEPEYVVNGITEALAKDDRLNPQEFNDILREIYTSTLPEQDQYLLDITTEFVKKQEILFSLEKARELTIEGNYDSAKKIVNTAFSVGSSTAVKIFDHGASVSERIHQLTVPRKCLSSIILPEFDKATDGGCGSGEIMTIIAPTGRGKTMFLVNFAKGGLLRSKNILYVTLETSAEVICQRLDSSLISRTRSEIRSNAEESIRLVEGHYTRFGGKVIVAEFLAGKATVTSLEHLAEDLMLKYGISFDALIVDYADLLKGSSSYSDKRFELEEIYIDLRSLGKILDVPVLTASQSNRGGFSADTVDMSHMSNDISKAFTSDIVATLSQTRAEFEMTPQVMRLFIAKSRNNPAGFFIPVVVDPATMMVVANGSPLKSFKPSGSSKGSENKRELPE